MGESLARPSDSKQSYRDCIAIDALATLIKAYKLAAPAAFLDYGNELYTYESPKKA